MVLKGRGGIGGVVGKEGTGGEGKGGEGNYEIRVGWGSVGSVGVMSSRVLETSCSQKDRQAGNAIV